MNKTLQKNQFCFLSTLLQKLLFFVILLYTPLLQAQTSNQLWDAYKLNPENHPNIPNCSFAGYHCGEAAIPNVSSTLYNVKSAPFNAAGNGSTDDRTAIQAAIDSAGKHGGGIVYLPAGTYKLSGLIHIKYSNVVLRGAGTVSTILDFSKSLQTSYGDFIYKYGATNNYLWWWSGGLVWMGPDDTFDGSGKIFRPDTIIQGWEYWRTTFITNVTGTYTRGNRVLTVSNASALHAGQKVIMTWQNPADKSFLKNVYGHAATEIGIDNGTGGVGNCLGILPTEYTEFQWAVEIASISGNQVTLKQPLRLNIQTNWSVKIEQITSIIEESGIENLRIQLHAKMSHKHLTKPVDTVGGWNAIYLNRSWNCWVNNVTITSAEEGVIISSTKNVTVSNVLINGNEQNHHSFACRVGSHDNLFENFTVNGPDRVRHGINTEYFSSGNVWSKGLQKVGTFDSHRAMPFDFIRTECIVSNDAGSSPGGGSGAGPYVGNRVVHWNIYQYIDPMYTLTMASSRGGDDTYEPKQYVMGAMVGIRGVLLNTSEGESMPLGDKGTIVSDEGLTPTIVNLYEAQKDFRLNVTSMPSLFTENINANALSIYPNPVKSELNLSYLSTMSGSLRISIINDLGIIMEEFTEDVLEGDNQIILSPKITSGIYLLKLSINGVSISKTFYKI